MRHSSLTVAAGILGFLGVAFGAHALKLEGKPLEWWHTASQYHLIHALAALLAAILGVTRAGWLFVAGTVVFAGSLYTMALTGKTWLGAITPIGGVLYLVGWASLTFAGSRAQAVSDATGPRADV